MKELIDAYGELGKHFSSTLVPVILLICILVYFLYLFLTKRIEGIASRFEEIAKTSLEIKKEIRHEERSELVAFRVAVEKWEDSLQMIGPPTASCCGSLQGAPEFPGTKF